MIETQRLILKPLTYQQLVKYIKNDNSLEEELKLNPTSRDISDELKEALEQTILPNVANTNKNYLYSTLWTVILKAENKMVADLCFVGEPNAKGELEIGYGTYEAFRKQGYMTEAVGGMLAWAARQTNVQLIFADTEKDNAASFAVLEKNKFIKVSETETMLTWHFKIN